TADQPDFVLTAGPEGRVTVVYRIRDDAAAVAAGLAVSQDLTNWQPAGLVAEVVSEQPQGDGSKIVTVQVAVGAVDRYLRLEARPLP
ncbi:MAG: hypothetical protein ACKV19_22860, partial [Verrucomicrobiales bacterium]